METRAKNLSTQASDHSLHASASSQRLNPIDIHDHSNIQHLTIAKYLPVQTFKQPRTLITALNQIFIDTKRMPRGYRSTMLENLAKNIALTTAELNVDYGSKLALIHAASSHRIFKSRSMIKHLTKLMISSILKTDHRTEAQKILDDAIISIQRSRNHIILC